MPITKNASQASPAANLTWPILGIVAALALVLLGISLAGRRDEQLPILYGRRRGAEAAGSVNGTAVLADLYRSTGRRVSRSTNTCTNHPSAAGPVPASSPNRPIS